MNVRWRQLAWLSIAELLALSLWFSASAVLPALVWEWQLGDVGRAWLTNAVQLGFIVGLLGSALGHDPAAACATPRPRLCRLCSMGATVPEIIALR